MACVVRCDGNGSGSDDDERGGPSTGGAAGEQGEGGGNAARGGASSGGDAGTSGTAGNAGNGVTGGAGAGGANNGGASSGTAGVAGEDPGAGAGGEPPDVCDGISLTSSGVLDLDLESIRISGAVTLRGAPLAAAETGKAWLVFMEQRTGSMVTVPAGATGGSAYAANLVPGVYDIRYRAPANGCSPSTGELPCADGVLREGVALSADGALDIDVPSVRVSGSVTLGGGALPTTAASRGAVRFEKQGGGSGRTQDLGPSGGATYSLALLPGRYDVSLDANEGLCSSTTPPAVPCVDGTLRRDVDLQTNGTLDFDFQVARIQGGFTLSGAAMPDAAGSRGRVTFTNVAGGALGRSSDLGSTGAARYAVTLLPGEYDVGLDANEALCSDPEPPLVPCVDGVLQRRVNLAADGALDLNAGAARIRGVVTLNGAEMPQATANRGTLRFVGTTSGSSVESSPLGTGGVAAYAVTLLPGAYDVVFNGNETLCASSSPPDVPCVDGTVRRNVQLSASGALDLELTSARIQGNVTVNGSAAPAASASRGALRFVNTADGTATLSSALGSSGDATYAVTLLTGQYAVWFDANEALCSGPAPPVPCIDATLDDSMNVTLDGVFDLDVPAIQLSGAFTLNGEALPALSIDRGMLSFLSVEHQTASIGLRLGTSGAGSYAVTLLPGFHVIHHRGTVPLCEAAHSTKLPCGDVVVRGCEEN